MAPANRASIAAGPALKLVHCTLTCGPMALSKKPLALPTMACACVILGKAPTRMVVGACAHPATGVASHRPTMIQIRLLTLGASDHHGENAGGFLRKLLTLAGLTGSVLGVDDQVGQRRVIEDASRGVADI